MKNIFLICILGCLHHVAAAQNCDIAQTGVVVYNASGTSVIAGIDPGQVANFKFSVKNAGLDPGCTIPANTVVASFDFPTLAGGIKPYKYDGPVSFVSGYFTWIYNSADDVLEATNTTPIPAGMGDVDILVKVKGNVAGKGRSNLNLTQGKGLSDNSGNNFSGTQLVVSGAILPIKLSAFSIIAEHCDALLSWTTATEEPGFSHFEIEYSPDNSSFVKIGTVQGKNLIAGGAYSFRYNQLSGNGYYRLKQLDKDGRFEYSQIVRTLTNCKDIIKVLVYPNPVQYSQKLIVNISGRKGKITGELYDVAGKKLQVYNLLNIANELAISALSAGTYTLYIRSDGEEAEAFKVVVTR